MEDSGVAIISQQDSVDQWSFFYPEGKRIKKAVSFDEASHLLHVASLSLWCLGMERGKGDELENRRLRSREVSG